MPEFWNLLLFIAVCVQYVSVADPGSGAFSGFLIPGSGMGKKTGYPTDPGSGSGINKPDNISESLKNNFLG